MTKMHQQDVEEIAKQISARYGSFNVSNLINYGHTVVVKPGATTDAGRPIRGLEIAEALSGDFAVQPLAVTYGSSSPFGPEEDPTIFERAMNMELDAADAEMSAPSFSDEDQFGFDSFSPDDPLNIPPSTVRLRSRYQRISSRFGHFAVSALRTGRVAHRQAAARVYNRIKSLWSKMISRSVPVMGLMSPETIRRRVYEVARMSPSSTSAMAPSGAPIFPMKAPMVAQATGMPKPLAFDQAALERSVGLNATSQLLAQTFGGVPSISADTRAETVGYLFSKMEHDYFGLVSTPFQIVLADEDEAVLDEEEDLEALEREPESSEQEVEQAPAEKRKISEGLPDDDADIEAATEEDLTEDLSKMIPDDDSDLDELDVDEQGLAVSDEDLESDADLLDDDDDMLGDDLDEDDLLDDDDDLIEDAPPTKAAPSAPSTASRKGSEPKDGVAQAVDAAVNAVADASALVSTVKSMSQISAPPSQPAPAGEPIATSPEHAKRLAQARAKVNAFLSKLQSDAASADARGDQAATEVLKERIVSLRDRLMALDKAIRSSSMSGSINYRSLVPAPSDTKDKIVVIAVRKSPAPVSEDQAVVKRYAEERGVSSDGHLADVFGADMLAGGGSLQISGSLVANQTGTMSADRAMNVFGAYLFGIDEEVKRVAAFGGLAASDASLKRYQQMSIQYEAAKAADDQIRAAAILGRMKAIYPDLLSSDRVSIVDPFSLMVPGIEIAKKVDPKAAAAASNIDRMLRMQA